MLHSLFIVFLFFSIGWCGSYLLYVTVLYVISSVYHTCHLDENYDRGNKWLRFIEKAYSWLQVDFFEDNIEESRIPVKVMFALVPYACLGTYAVVSSFVIAIVAIIVVNLWSTSKNK